MTSSIVAIAGLNGTVSTINCDTLAVTNLPAASKGWDIHSIALLGENDIWVGLDGGGQGTGTKPFLEHWNGTAWTAHEVSGVVAHPDTRGYDVGSVLYLSPTEAYASVDPNGAGVSKYLLQWDGVSWTTLTTVPFLARGGQIGRDSTGSDIWAVSGGSGVNDSIFHWNGATIDENQQFGFGANCSGLAVYDSVICTNPDNAAANVYRRDSAGSWSVEFTIASGTAQTINGTGGTNMWVDPVSGDLWVLATVSGVKGIVRWDGASQTFESMATALSTGSAFDLVGVELAGSKFQVWAPNTLGGAVYRDADTGLWGTVSATVSQPRVAAAFQGDTNTPPYITDASPASGDSSLQPDVGVAVSVVDDDSNLQLSATRIYLNGTLAWSGGTQLSGFSGGLETVANPDGYRFGLTPADPFEPGVQTVRVVASDGIASIDESYSFTTVARVEESDEEPASETEPTGIDLLLGETSRDISVDSGDLPLVAGVDEVVQHLRVGLRLYRGEWFLEPESGIPYYQYVMVSAPNSRVIEGIFRQDILGDTDIEELSLLEMDLDLGARSLEVEFTAKSSVGPVEVSSVFP